MQIDFQQIKKKENEDLLAMLQNPTDYLPEVIDFVKKELSIRGESPDFLNNSNNLMTCDKKEASNPKDLCGVGGWLAFLVFSLMILGPLLNFGKMGLFFRNAYELHPHLNRDVNFQHFELQMWAIFIISHSATVIAGYKLWKKHTVLSVQFARRAIWFAGPICTIALMVTTMNFAAYKKLAVAAEYAIPIAFSFLHAIIWSTYLKRSRRVASTYHDSIFL